MSEPPPEYETSDWYSGFDMEWASTLWGVAPEHYYGKVIDEHAIPVLDLPNNPESGRILYLSEHGWDLIEGETWDDFHDDSSSSFSNSPSGMAGYLKHVFSGSWELQVTMYQGVRAWTVLDKQDPYSFTQHMREEMAGYDPEVVGIEFESNDVDIVGASGAGTVNNDYMTHDADPEDYGGEVDEAMAHEVYRWASQWYTCPQVTWSEDFRTIFAEPNSGHPVVVRPKVGESVAGSGAIAIVPSSDTTPEVEVITSTIPWGNFITSDKKTFAIGSYLGSHEVPGNTSRDLSYGGIIFYPSSVTLQIPSYRWLYPPPEVPPEEIAGRAEEIRRRFV